METKNYSEKGQVNESVSGIVTLIIGVGVAVLILIFIGVLGGQTYNLTEADLDEIANNEIAAESFTPLNNTKILLAHKSIQEGTLKLENSTSIQIALSNFTIDYENGALTLKTTSRIGLNNSVMTANYTWGAQEVRNSAKNSIISGFEALETTGSYLPIIVLAVIIALVLAMVIGFTAFGVTRGGSGGQAL